MSQFSRVAVALFLGAAVGVAGSSALIAQQPARAIAPAKRAAIFRLLELTGAAPHFTQPQIEELVRFYESPLGRHLTNGAATDRPGQHAGRATLG